MAIAFHDSGRMLPYRHKYLQKQIEQRNSDAEDMREYIGRTGSALGNMMERTGRFFGAPLSSNQESKEYLGKHGGEAGRDVAKAGWQKGVMDDENKRRTVTHRLGLLMEHMKAGNLDRKARAWKGNDETAVSKQFDNRFKLFSKHMGTMLRSDLINMYPDMYSSTTMEHYNEIIKEQNKEKLQENLDKFNRNPKHAPFMDYKKWARDRDMYDPSVYSEPFEGLAMLTSYLKKEVGFDIGDEDKKEEKSQFVASEEQPSDDGRTSVDDMNQEVTGKRKKPPIKTKVKEKEGGSEEYMGLNKEEDTSPSPSLEDYIKNEDGSEASTLEQWTSFLPDWGRWLNANILSKSFIKEEVSKKKKQVVKSNLKQSEVQIALKNLDAILESKLGIPFVDLRQGLGFGKGYEGEWDDPRSEGGSKYATKEDITHREEEVSNEALIATGGAFHREVESIDTTSTHTQMTPQKVLRNTRLLEDNRKPGYKLTNDSDGKSNAGYLIDDKGGRPILPGGVSLNYHLSDKENKLELANRVIDLMGGIPKGSQQRAMLLKYATSSVADLKKTFGYARGGKKLTPKQEAARRAIKLTPDQVDKLVTHTWVDHLAQFNNNHSFIGQNSTKVYNDNPYLKHLVGDMAYRLGPAFMTTDKWKDFKDGMSLLVNSEDETSKVLGVGLMKESFAKNYPRDHMDRFDYLNDRLNKMEGWITRNKYAGKGTENITLFKGDNLSKPEPKTKYTGQGNTLILNYPSLENPNAGYQQVGE